MLYVVKRDGRLVDFDSLKISKAIKRAANETGDNIKESELLEIVKKVISYIELSEKEKINVEEIQNLIEKALLLNNYINVKNVYSSYRKERTKVREIKSDLM